MTKAEKFVLKRRLRDCYSTDKSRVYEIAEREIDRIPTTEDRPKGEWVEKEGREEGYDIGGVKTWYVQIMCNKCGFIKTAIEGHTSQYNFCPFCGADMRGEG